MDGPGRIVRWGVAAVLVAATVFGVYEWNRDDGPTGIVLDDPGQRVASARWVDDIDDVRAKAPAAGPGSSGVDVVSGPGDRTWFVYLGVGCTDGAELEVPADGGEVVLTPYENPPPRDCDDMGVTQAVEVRWADGRRPARLEARRGVQAR